MATKQRSYCHAPRKSPFIWATVGQKLYMEAERYPNNEMYVFYADKERKTIMQMKEESQNLAASLLSLGLRKGDTLAILGNSHSEGLVALFACMQIGVITVHPRLEFTANNIQAMMRKTSCKGLFLTRSPENLIEIVKKIIPDTDYTNEPQHFKSESLPDLGFIIAADKNISSVCYCLDSLLSKTDDVLRAQVVDTCLSLDPDDPCSIYFTSGSTGLPKGVLHSHNAMLNAAMAGRADIPTDTRVTSIRFAITASLSELSSYFGVLLPITLPNATSVVVSPTYDTIILANALQDERCNSVVLFIHHLSELVNITNLQSYDFSTLILIVVSGSIVPSSLRNKAKKLAKYATNAYGSTEMLGVLMSHPVDPVEVLDSAAVYPYGGTEVKIVNDKGEMVPVNTRGKICVRSNYMFKCYWMDEKKTKEVKDENGWYHTGDLGIMDAKGFVQILGRDSELIIMKEADNLAPMELEAVLYEHEAVEDALVVAIPDERSYEEVCACIKIRKSHTISEDEVRQFCEGKVFTLLMPKHVLFVESFPTTDTGKFHRIRMAEAARELLNRSTTI